MGVLQIAGWTIGRLRMERHLEDWVMEFQAAEADYAEKGKTWAERVEYGLAAVRDIVGKVWVYVVLGSAVGAGIHGYVPEAFMTSIMGKGAALGTVLALMMSVIALSLPEDIILRKVLKPTLISVFFGVVGIGILIVGYLFNLLI